MHTQSQIQYPSTFFFNNTTTNVESYDFNKQNTGYSTSSFLAELHCDSEYLGIPRKTSRPPKPIGTRASTILFMPLDVTADDQAHSMYPLTSYETLDVLMTPLDDDDMTGFTNPFTPSSKLEFYSFVEKPISPLDKSYMSRPGAFSTAVGVKKQRGLARLHMIAPPRLNLTKALAMKDTVKDVIILQDYCEDDLHLWSPCASDADEIACLSPLAAPPTPHLPTVPLPPSAHARIVYPNTMVLSPAQSRLLDILNHGPGSRF
ncbi:hypothetical protein BDQ17DRAFT_1413146 [Cyathus striatus]|nr:hypothetical protein BDQ17DRAFT_1413146 [Cyathus striatus]